MRNKGALIVKLALLFLVLAILVFAAFKLVNSSFIGIFNFGLSKELVESKSFSGITDIELSVVTESVTVEEYDGSETLYEYYSTSSKNAPVVEQSGATLKVTQTVERRLQSISRSNITIKVPRGQAASFTLSALSGSLSLNAKSLIADLSTISGSIKVYRGGLSLTAGTTSGSIRVFEAFEKVSASSVSGSIKIRANDSTSSVSAETVSGSIKVMLPPSAGYELHYSTTTGSVKDEYRGKSFEKEGTASFGSDGANIIINASSISGSIKLCDFDLN